MNVILPAELERMVQQEVSSGRYGSASEVLQEALRLLQERDRAREARLEQLRCEVAVGIDQLDRGEGIPAEEAFRTLRARIAAGRTP